MKKIRLSICLLLLMLLVACGNSSVADQSDVDKVGTDVENRQNFVQSPMQDPETEMNAIADFYADIYETAASQKTFSSVETKEKIVARLGENGYPVVDNDNDVNMVNAEAVETFCEQVDARQQADLVLLTVLNNGGFYRYDFLTTDGAVDVKTYGLQWTDGQRQVETYQEYTAYTWQYTQKGYLLFEQYHPPGYDGPSGHKAIRVKSLDETCRKYNEIYIKPIGYNYNNMFITDWSEQDFEQLDFYDMFEAMYVFQYGHPFSVEKDISGHTYEVEKDEFEKVLQSYFKIDSQTLQKNVVYYPDQGKYRYRTRGLGDYCWPNYPNPEVVAETENGDGTITLIVDAIWSWENNDHAFTHEVVVRPLEDGSFQYVSNRVLSWSDGVQPEWYQNRLTDDEWDEYYKDM